LFPPKIFNYHPPQQVWERLVPQPAKEPLHTGLNSAEKLQAVEKPGRNASARRLQGLAFSR
jgi:hypothetical protein